MNDSVNGSILHESTNVNEIKPWIIMIVDDDEDIHVATHFSLNTIKIHDRPMAFIDCYTGAEAKKIVEERQDIDLMLLDAVMESNRAGLDCAEYVKLTLKRKIPTIVMRSGFAGWEMEFNKHEHECIDDFILKTEASRQRLIEVLTKWLNPATV